MYKQYAVIDLCLAKLEEQEGLSHAAMSIGLQNSHFTCLNTNEDCGPCRDEASNHKAGLLKTKIKLKLHCCCLETGDYTDLMRMCRYRSDISDAPDCIAYCILLNQ